MSRVRVERVGGLAGFGGAGSHLASRGEVDLSTLNDVDRRVVAALLARGPSERTERQSRDAFRYRITHVDEAGAEQITEVDEHELPAALRDCVRDEFV